MSATTTKPSARETAGEIRTAIDTAKAKSLELSHDLDAARKEQVRSGTLATGATGRVSQLARKLEETERRIAELQRQAEVADRLAAEEDAAAVRERVEEIRAEAATRRAAETAEFEAVAEAFSQFVARAVQFQALVAHGLETRAALRREFSSDRNTLAELLRVVRPAVSPVPADLQQVFDVLAGPMATAATSLTLDADLESAKRSPERPWAASSGWESSFD